MATTPVRPERRLGIETVPPPKKESINTPLARTEISLAVLRMVEGDLTLTLALPSMVLPERSSAKTMLREYLETVVRYRPEEFWPEFYAAGRQILEG